MVKAAVCKTAIHRFESGRRLQLISRGGGMADAADLKSAGVKSLWVRVPLPALVENKYALDNRSIRIYAK